jgi:FkbM family methyltransferase
MRHSILHTVGNVVWVVRNERSDALPLLAVYSRLKLQELLSARRRRDGVRRTRILGMDVSFFDYYWLLEMFEEIFLRKQYYFASDNPRPLIIDVGSNIGLTILFFKRLFPGARVIGFEPDPKTFHVLAENVGRNRLADVRLLNQAVHEGSASVSLFVNPETPGSPQMSTRNERIAGVGRTVRATRLSEYVTEPVDFLKIDVEGAEQAVLDDLERSEKLRLVRRMAVEYHHHLDPEEDALSGMLSSLERNGFGYQIEARLDGLPGSRARHYQNVLLNAYRKDPGARTGLKA